MKIVLNVDAYNVYTVNFKKDDLGREIREIVLDGVIVADVQYNHSSLQVEQYGDRINNILTVYTNDIIEEDCLLEIDYKLYRIISIKKFSAFPPTHYVMEVEADE